jgi:hypothetical protein
VCIFIKIVHFQESYKIIFYGRKLKIHHITSTFNHIIFVTLVWFETVRVYGLFHVLRRGLNRANRQFKFLYPSGCTSILKTSKEQVDFHSILMLGILLNCVGILEFLLKSEKYYRFST